MAKQIYAPIDIQVRALARLTVPSSPAVVDGLPLSDTLIPFQFPPRITVDSKAANWQEEDVAGYEPIAIWKGAKARSITLEWEYVVVESEGAFTVDKISDIARTIKGYFYRNVNTERMPVFEITGIYDIIGASPKSQWRGESANVIYSPQIISVAGKTFPLHTKISLQLYLVTKIKGAEGEELKQDAKLANSNPLKQWY